MLHTDNNSIPQKTPDEPNPETESFTDKILREIKEPLVISLLVFLSQQQFLTDLIIKHVPKIVDADTGIVNNYGFIIKSILVGVIFYFVKKYVLN